MGSIVAPQEQCVLRHARKDDSRHLAELIVIAGDQRPDFPYTPDPDSDGPIDLARPRAALKNENFALRHATLAEISGRVAGMALGYKLTRRCEALKPDGLAQSLRPLMEPEFGLIDTFYINTLAVYPNYQNHGLGARLLEAANRKALKTGCSGLSLEVGEHNRDAFRFYVRHGFNVVMRRHANHRLPEPYDRDIAFLWRTVIR